LAETKPNSKPKSEPAVNPVVVIVVGLVALIGGALYWYLRAYDPSQAREGPALTPEAKDYVTRLKLSGVSMKATGSYMAGRVVEILGSITNAGDRRLEIVEITCIFRDPYAQVVLKRRIPIVSRRMGGLKPGETKSFRLAFDDIPESWNQDVPFLVIAHISFGS